MQVHLAVPHFGHGYLAVATPGHQGQAVFHELVGGFVAAAAQNAAVLAVAVHHHHAVAAALVLGVGYLLAVGADDGLRKHVGVAVAAALPELGLGLDQRGHGLAVQVAVVAQPLFQEYLIRHVQRRADAHLNVARDARQVQDVLDGGVAVALGHVVPDALAGQRGAAQKERGRAVAGGVALAHVAHVAVHVHAPALGGVGRSPTDEPVGQLQQVAALQHFLQRAAVHHVVEQHLGYLGAELALKLGFLAAKGNLYLAHAGQRGLAAVNLLLRGREADVALAQVAYRVVEQQRGFRVRVVADERRDAPELLLGVLGGTTGAALAALVVQNIEVLGGELLPARLLVLHPHPAKRLLRRLGLRGGSQQGRRQPQQPGQGSLHEYGVRHSRRATSKSKKLIRWNRKKIPARL